jgi:hypothetical protein
MGANSTVDIAKDRDNRQRLTLHARGHGERFPKGEVARDPRTVRTRAEARSPGGSEHHLGTNHEQPTQHSHTGNRTTARQH